MRGPQPWKTNRSRSLRSQPVSAEERLWAYLRNRQLGGFKFVRQAPIGPYFADFLCREAKVVVEVDGATHGEDHEIVADQVRTRDLERLGYGVFRATNGDIYENVNGVLDQLLAILESRDEQGRD